MENKTGKYLKYAIGEIILVVIGILLALQINTWNENRIDSKRLNLYTQSLLNDLELDKKRLIECMVFDSTKVSIIDSLSEPVQDFIEDYSDRGILTIKSIKVNNATFKTMSSNNDLELYQNIDLQNSISKYYADVEYVIRFENVYINNSYSNFEEFVTRNRGYTLEGLKGYLNSMKSASENESDWYKELIELNESITKKLKDLLKK
ncbi:hypothetical protein SAMN04515667_2061 [Formosa sp. Hel1_31_208]|uniref:DUF6090 family protein n=1 Tax=Formosa sp. Hel1_31_208 TaxID=1798225 RepID=UPI00087CE5A1|nr:DUF6090 family protein [Formosa sp. Hel1_31_208]SDS38830.1 hypothetical protein SAMN04515667_2061 [Formosa sp. Hel1_31_208]